MEYCFGGRDENINEPWKFSLFETKSVPFNYDADSVSAAFTKVHYEARLSVHRMMMFN